MKNLILLIALVMSVSVSANTDSTSVNGTQEVVNQSVPVGYVIGIIKRGDNWEQDSLMAFKLQEKHLNFLAKLREDNKLVASGPLTTSPDARGLYIFNVATISEAKMLVSEDEAIKSGWIKMEFHNWEARDYDVRNGGSDELAEEESIFSGGLAMLLIIFSLVILVLMLRTFRGKASI
jgi:uncharacterized protein YciI